MDGSGAASCFLVTGTVALYDGENNRLGTGRHITLRQDCGNTLDSQSIQLGMTRQLLTDDD